MENDMVVSASAYEEGIRPSAHGSVSDAVKTEKISWYREVLQLEPGSKIFLPFARLLEDMGRNTDAVQVLREGLERHPEFIEARLFLIDVLHKNGQPAQCGAEVARLAGLFREYPGFWEAWSSVEENSGHKPDLSVSLGFLGAMFRNCDITLVDVLSAGLRTLQTHDTSAETGWSAAPASPSFAAPQSFPAPETPARATGLSSAAELNMPGQAIRGQADGARAEGAFEIAAFDGGESEDSESDGGVFDEGESPALTSPPPFVFRESGTSSEAVEPAEEKCSLRTRSMAEVLAEQGDVRGAVDIYEELFSCCRPEDRPSLEVRLEDLRARLGEQGTPAASYTHSSASSQAKKVPVKPRNGVLDLLEKLAVRLENKARQ